MAITAETITSLTTKLDEWARGLDDDERAVLNVLVARGAAPEEEVAGFDLSVDVTSRIGGGGGYGGGGVAGVGGGGGYGGGGVRLGTPRFEPRSLTVPLNDMFRVSGP